MPTRSRFPTSRHALIVVDAINPFDFPGGNAFATRAARTARAIAALANRARRAGVPVVFVNDNLGRWRSDTRQLLEFVENGTAGAKVTAVLRPDKEDFVILKSTLSGFYQTPLETMLRLGGVKTVVVCGFATDACVFLTAADAYMRDFDVVIPRDCVGAQSPREQHDALRRMADVIKARVQTSASIKLRR